MQNSYCKSPQLDYSKYSNISPLMPKFQSEKEKREEENPHWLSNFINKNIVSNQSGRVKMNLDAKKKGEKNSKNNSNDSERSDNEEEENEEEIEQKNDSIVEEKSEDTDQEEQDDDLDEENENQIKKNSKPLHFSNIRNRNANFLINYANNVGDNQNLKNSQDKLLRSPTCSPSFSKNVNFNNNNFKNLDHSFNTNNYTTSNSCTIRNIKNNSYINYLEEIEKVNKIPNTKPDVSLRSKVPAVQSSILRTDNNKPNLIKSSFTPCVPDKILTPPNIQNKNKINLNLEPSDFDESPNLLNSPTSKNFPSDPQNNPPRMPLHMQMNNLNFNFNMNMHNQTYQNNNFHNPFSNRQSLYSNFNTNSIFKNNDKDKKVTIRKYPEENNPSAFNSFNTSYKLNSFNNLLNENSYQNLQNPQIKESFAFSNTGLKYLPTNKIKHIIKKEKTVRRKRRNELEVIIDTDDDFSEIIKKGKRKRSESEGDIVIEAEGVVEKKKRGRKKKINSELDEIEEKYSLIRNELDDKIQIKSEDGAEKRKGKGTGKKRGKYKKRIKNIELNNAKLKQLTLEEEYALEGIKMPILSEVFTRSEGSVVGKNKNRLSEIVANNPNFLSNHNSGMVINRNMITTSNFNLENFYYDKYGNIKNFDLNQLDFLDNNIYDKKRKKKNKLRRAKMTKENRIEMELFERIGEVNENDIKHLLNPTSESADINTSCNYFNPKLKNDYLQYLIHGKSNEKNLSFGRDPSALLTDLCQSYNREKNLAENSSTGGLLINNVNNSGNILTTISEIEKSISTLPVLKIPDDCKYSGIKEKKRRNFDNGERKYECKICTAAFDSRQGLGGHVSRIHQGQSENYNKKKAVRNRREKERDKLREIKRIILARYGKNFDQLMADPTNEGKRTVKRIIAEHHPEYVRLKREMRKKKN